MARLVVMPPTGEPKVFVVQKLLFDELYKHINCHTVERVKVRYEGKLRDAYVDEEALLKVERPAPNHAITQMLDGAFKGYPGTIYGTAVIWVPGK